MSPAVIEFLESIVYGNRRDVLSVSIRGILRGLSVVYRAGLWVYLLPFEIGLRRKHRLGRPVISIGNLTVGGTGKTPATQYLCKGLVNRGWNPAVLSYGYGGSLHGRFGVVSDKTGVLLTPDAAGDEPVMLASDMPGVPVLVCKHRTTSSRAAIRDAGADVLVLDDGFQVWKLHRDLDIVLVNAAKPFDNGRTLPAGRLREPLSALKRADCIIMMGDCGSVGVKSPIPPYPHTPIQSPVFHGLYIPYAVRLLSDGSEMEVEAIRGMNILALSSIANPDSFEETLAATGAKIVGTERFPDHYLYSAKDIDNINKSAADSGADYIITTDKDAVKLTGYKFSVPIAALSVELALDDGESFWKLVEGKLLDIK